MALTTSPTASAPTTLGIPGKQIFAPLLHNNLHLLFLCFLVDYFYPHIGLKKDCGIRTGWWEAVTGAGTNCGADELWKKKEEESPEHGKKLNSRTVPEAVKESPFKKHVPPGSK
ncbi:FAM168B protein [Platysternon megacephalum]|uniref:FAM168B protein n=1 Tax=Platysternon megacephalum TaxID=55544 RepID=A0A4D9E9G2_9SAUR|nr:FAM168B protein [Platysternon megacephalum]